MRWSIITEWNEFRGLDLARMKQLLRQPNVVDLRNVYNPAEMAEAGFALQQHRPALRRQIGNRRPMAQDTHRFDPTAIREYDIRGVVGRTLSATDAYAVGRGFGTMVQRGRRQPGCRGL